ncbi:hypothetical protein CIPAW_13G045300 [Carya illinoinensis]|uniref:Uncharacterized protein n=1 Tax=Carya illinoinensis TaxID=32201 RepID=A0A8T1NKC1_CARIL|nr:hypothetical protein CIPAW_13G045300 [Carya illinoinensis]
MTTYHNELILKNVSHPVTLELQVTKPKQEELLMNVTNNLIYL